MSRHNAKVSLQGFSELVHRLELPLLHAPLCIKALEGHVCQRCPAAILIAHCHHKALQHNNTVCWGRRYQLCCIQQLDSNCAGPRCMTCVSLQALGAPQACYTWLVIAAPKLQSLSQVDALHMLQLCTHRSLMAHSPDLALVNRERSLVEM